MSNKNIFQQDAEIPDIVQQKANLALAQIYARQDEEPAKNGDNVPGKSAGTAVIEAMPKHVNTEKKASSKKAQKTSIVKLATTAIAAVVTVAAVVVAIVYFTGKNIGGYDDHFSLMVNAAELETGRALPIAEDIDDKCFSYGDDWYGNVDYEIEIPLTIEGENIESVSYNVNEGCFRVVSIDCPSIVSAGIANSDPHEPSTYDEGYDMAGNFLGSTTVEFYDTFSVDYDVQKGSKHTITVLNNLTNRMDLYYLLGYTVSDEVTDAALTYMMKDTVITVEVKFKDGTTSTRNLGLFAKQYSVQDTSSGGTGNPCTISGFFCYEIGDTDEETKRIIDEQIACVEDYIETYDLNNGETGPDSHVPEFSRDFNLPGFDEMSQLGLTSSNSGMVLSKSGKEFNIILDETSDSGFYNVALRYGDVMQEVAASVSVVDNVAVERDVDTAFAILVLRQQDGATYSIVYEMTAQGINEYAEYDGAKYSYPDLK